MPGRACRLWSVAPLLVLAVLALARPLSAQPFGPEFRVNTYTTGTQRRSKVAFDVTGRSVVVWPGAGASGGGIYGQRYDASGAPLGGEFRVNTVTTDNATSPVSPATRAATAT